MSSIVTRQRPRGIKIGSASEPSILFVVYFVQDARLNEKTTTESPLMPALYRDPLVDNVGVWGVPTSTLDWCEENYVVTKYVAEFCEC